MEDIKYNKILLEMKEKLRNNNLIGNDLIKLYDDTNFFNFINNRAEKVILFNMSRSNFTSDEYYIVIISLSLIALKTYNGSFYDNLEKYYIKLYECQSKQKVNAKIREILSKFKNNDKRYIEYPIKNSIVPYEFLDEYYEFMNDIYELNFQRSLPENIEDEIKDVFEGISEKIREDSDVLDIDVTNKTYKLIQSTQNIIKNKQNIDEICEFSKNILKYIDYKEWNNQDIDYENSYYKDGYEKYINRVGKVVYRKKGERETKEYSRWKPSFVIENNSVFLYTPIHKIPKNFDPTKIKIYVYNDTDLVALEEKPIVEQAIGYYIVKPKNIEVENPIGKVTYQLKEENKIIYDSGDKLFREYILFNENGQEIQSNNLYEGICLVVSDRFDNEEIKEIKRNMFYILGEIYVKKNGCFLLKDNLICFNEKINPGIEGEEINNVKALKDESEIKIYNKVKSILCNYNCNISNLAMEVDNARFKVLERNYSVNDVNSIIQIDLSELKDGYYKIKVYDYTNSKVFYRDEFLLDSKLSLETSKIEKNIYCIKVSSSFFNTIEKKVNIKESIDTRIPFKDKYTYDVTLNIPLYKIDDKVQWYTMDEYIWWKDIDIYSKLYFKNIKYNKFYIKDKYQNQLGEITFSDYQTILNLDIFNKYKEEPEIIVTLKNNYITLGTISILNYCKIIANETNAIYDKEKKELIIKTVYFGKSDLKLCIKDVKNNVVIKQFDIKKNESEIKIKNIMSKKIYKIQYFEEKYTSMFFFNTKLIYEDEIIFFDYEDFIGRYYKIESIKYDNYLKKIIDKEGYLKNTFIIIDEHKYDDIYSGKIYQMRKNVPYYFKNVNPVKIEFLTSNYSETITTIITTEDDDGLLLNNINKTIAEYDSKECSLINEYEVSIIRKERKF